MGATETRCPQRAVGKGGHPTAPGRLRGHPRERRSLSPVTTISYEIAKPSHVRLDVYNAAGQLVRVLVDSRKSEGRYRMEWNGLDTRGMQAASGVYFCRLQAGEFEQTRKMVLVR